MLPSPLLLVAWRLTVAASGLLGVVLAAQVYDVWWTALSQLANLAVAGTYAALAVLAAAGRDTGRSWLPGALAATMCLVALAYLPQQNGNLLTAWSLLEHVVTPVLVVLDYVLGRRRAAARWWHPLTWTIAPLAYLAWYVSADLAVYDALDPGRPLVMTGQVVVLGAVLVGCGYALVATGRRTVVA
ncbi:hypothetical protein [Nocardioides sp. AX2bis]|uniref:hypothetical protein n=1 Tax=Nocardioides sp. AX2bis TaxID=2653157 RepID=UPI001F2266D9|nr:hypothetical protein [Nocardioides sp. AX2bis]